MPPKKKNIEISESSTSFNFGMPPQQPVQTPIPVSQAVQPPVAIKASTGDTDRLQLAASINNLVLRGEQFTSAIESLNQFTKERLVQLDIQISSKKQEFTELSHQLENEYKNLQIKLKQELDEFKISAVEKVLSPLGFTHVNKIEYQNLKNENSDLRDTMEEKIESAVNIETSKKNMEKEIALQNRDLQHKAEVAGLRAEVEQQKKEIAMLNSTIQNMKQEIAAQRELTKEVAQASSKAQITQTIGKSN